MGKIKLPNYITDAINSPSAKRLYQGLFSREELLKIAEEIYGHYKTCDDKWCPIGRELLLARGSKKKVLASLIKEVSLIKKAFKYPEFFESDGIDLDKINNLVYLGNLPEEFTKRDLDKLAEESRLTLV